MPPTLHTEAIVLRTTRLAEHDRFLICLTPAYGKLTVVARGVRKPNSKLAGACGGMSELSLLLGTGKSMPALQQFETRQAFSGIRSCYEALTACLLMSEAVEKLTPHCAEGSDWMKHPEGPESPVLQIYDGFRRWLKRAEALAQADPFQLSALHLHLAVGLGQVLTLSGHGLNSHTCVQCHETLNDPEMLPVWTLHWPSHGVVCKGCRGWFAGSLTPLSPSTFRMLQRLSLDSETLRDLASEDFGVDLLQGPKLSGKALRFCLSWLQHTLRTAPKSLDSVQQTLVQASTPDG